MRTPNTSCMVCAIPLYRRPNELARVRHVACMAHRGEAQRLSGVTEAQRDGLSMGRAKGTNHRTGYSHKPESRAKTSESHKAWCKANPDAVAARGEKVRGEAHYLWKGGISSLNQSIRRMTENRRWMDSVKARDGRCLDCGSTEKLEAHHMKTLAALVHSLGIRSRDDARAHSAELWDLDNGRTLCRGCHYIVHERKRHAD